MRLLFFCLCYTLRDRLLCNIFCLYYRLWNGLFCNLFAFKLSLHVLGFHWLLNSVLSFIVLACEHINLFLSQFVKQFFAHWSSRLTDIILCVHALTGIHKANLLTLTLEKCSRIVLDVHWNCFDYVLNDGLYCSGFGCLKRDLKYCLFE